MDIGNNIKRIREEKKLGQVQLACKIVMASTTLCNIERGRVFPSLKTVQRIADALEVEIGDLLV